MRKYRRVWRAVLIALVGAGALSGCYYDAYTGLWYAYPPYYYPYPTQWLTPTARVRDIPTPIRLGRGQTRRRDIRRGPRPAMRRSSRHRCRHRHNQANSPGELRRLRAQRRHDLERVAEGSGIVGADVIGAHFRSVNLCCKRRRAHLQSRGTAGDRAQKGFA